MYAEVVRGVYKISRKKYFPLSRFFKTFDMIFRRYFDTRKSRV